MGRRGSQIIPFLMKGLRSKKYLNLNFENPDEWVFSLSLPRKTKKLDPKYEQILKDWRAFKKQSYSYTKAKQAVESALKKSAFLELISSSDDLWIYRKLTEEEVEEKKRQNKAKAAFKKEFSDPPSVNSSGYGSGEDSPAGPCIHIVEEDLYAMGTVKEEHAYSLVSEVEEYASGVNIDTVANVACVSAEEIPMRETETIPILVHDPDILPESSFVNPNDILIDYRNTSSSDLFNQTCKTEAMDIDHLEESRNENDSIISQALEDYLGPYYDFQNVFDDLAEGKMSDSEEFNELMKTLSDSVSPELDSNLETPIKKQTKFYFKESVSSSEGELWIFNPEVQELSTATGNECNTGPPLFVMDAEKIEKLNSCPYEFIGSKNQFIVILKHKHIESV